MGKVWLIYRHLDRFTDPITEKTNKKKKQKKKKKKKKKNWKADLKTSNVLCNNVEPSIPLLSLFIIGNMGIHIT